MHRHGKKHVNYDWSKKYKSGTIKIDEANIKDWNNTYFSFDHDIQDFNDDGSENTGYDCLKWLCDYIMDNDISCKNLNIFVHTKNPVGGNNIRHYHKNFMDFINKK